MTDVWWLYSNTVKKNQYQTNAGYLFNNQDQSDIVQLFKEARKGF